MRPTRCSRVAQIESTACYFGLVATEGVSARLRWLCGLLCALGGFPAINVIAQCLANHIRSGRAQSGLALQVLCDALSGLPQGIVDSNGSDRCLHAPTLPQSLAKFNDDSLYPVVL